MKITETLEQLGLHPNEVKIYLAALELGQANITELSAKVSIPRTTVREHIDEMLQKGLLNQFEKHGRTILIAVEPSRLLAHEQAKEVALSSILPELEAIREKSGIQKPIIRTFFGLSEIRQIYDDMIATKHPILGVDAFRDGREILGMDFMNSFVQRRYEHFLKIRLIVEKTPAALELQARDSDQLRRTRFLPDNFELRRTANFIYGNKVAMISFNRKEPTGIVIEDPDTAHTMSIFFESLWNQSTDK
ncbi:MAG: hypothetical protein A3C49_03965 [Candidatus Doudnabacteria bacterium RIFCSPHIGHO2_02_FULL_42_25]|uniref:Transcription regulator TrmB N-terminal domain-containing protein n=1 Tax=Candidatus Doudnabacteria bacterium RIFCSPHIGHO2_01_FULL_41_86 TaxID=1817821 RepID=A0A1F5N8R0_9BACT|nr:MAG: hypothetical protein A2717_00750 [Candidatus Doudnabacteria bacterium RIFCSPHIGHO2_01_FULL_41_86]OGE75372.1 MAG: hypothetical protein A3K07_01260 [Candidatus Doudnabacteria bacterium RIFCSPHIGHO2_01_43_10]OGE86601.1 MAG: hypothetical protein A3E28_04305 [Candidatus Doudnabacteria bacterium RIFCSPHIGHO2_12_FULL_42_22]OGE87501.1 MAG: hypothetical protein A3C49_03965 [Candidatus Doudnabacteria bacterium RIFCSPHIGHO2_02_FULL_42_25]OGE92764.1 MAG: hypothetical protein A2895_04550 [Candidatus